MAANGYLARSESAQKCQRWQTYVGVLTNRRKYVFVTGKFYLYKLNIEETLLFTDSLEKEDHLLDTFLPEAQVYKQGS